MPPESRPPYSVGLFECCTLFQIKTWTLLNWFHVRIGVGWIGLLRELDQFLVQNYAVHYGEKGRLVLGNTNRTHASKGLQNWVKTGEGASSSFLLVITFAPKQTLELCMKRNTLTLHTWLAVVNIPQRSNFLDWLRWGKGRTFVVAVHPPHLGNIETYSAHPWFRLPGLPGRQPNSGEAQTGNGW